MLKTKKYYRKKSESLQIFRRGLPGWFDNPVLGIGKQCKLSELESWLIGKINESGLEIVDESKAKMTCVAFAEYPDSQGYDVFGCSCFIGTFPEEPKVSYCGLCGDVNTFRITDTNSIKIFVR